MFGKSAKHSATASGYVKCGTCNEWGRCTCPKQRTKREREDAQERESIAYLKAHGRLPGQQAFTNKSGRLK